MRRLLVVLTLFMAGIPSWAGQPVKRIYAFGDSYSDIGRGYLDTDGPTAIAFFARRFCIEMVPSNAPSVKEKSLDFAVSGASTGRSPGFAVPGGWLAFGMKNQVDEFRAMVQSGAATFDPKTTLFFLAGGLNDNKLSTAEVRQNLESEIAGLYALGARRFLIALLPEKIPNFAAPGMKFNPVIREIPADLMSKLPDARIDLSGWGEFMDDVMVHAAAYGITNTTDRCAGRTIRHEDTTPCASPQKYYYYHDHHPSMAVSRIVGDKMYEQWTAVK